MYLTIQKILRRSGLMSVFAPQFVLSGDHEKFALAKVQQEQMGHSNLGNDIKLSISTLSS